MGERGRAEVSFARFEERSRRGVKPTDLYSSCKRRRQKFVGHGKQLADEKGRLPREHVVVLFDDVDQRLTNREEQAAKVVSRKARGGDKWRAELPYVDETRLSKDGEHEAHVVIYESDLVWIFLRSGRCFEDVPRAKRLVSLGILAEHCIDYRREEHQRQKGEQGGK
jgi:hypothetical protein